MVRTQAVAQPDAGQRIAFRKRLEDQQLRIVLQLLLHALALRKVKKALVQQHPDVPPVAQCQHLAEQRLREQPAGRIVRRAEKQNVRVKFLYRLQERVLRQKAVFPVERERVHLPAEMAKRRGIL